MTIRVGQLHEEELNLLVLDFTADVILGCPWLFQDFMHEVLREFLHRFVLVYIDDILIYSRSWAEHRQHVAEVLQRLKEHELFLKAEKCSFHQSSVNFLGYHIDQNGVRMDKGKVTAIRDWPIPTSVKELQRFLGSPISIGGSSKTIAPLPAHSPIS